MAGPVTADVEATTTLDVPSLVRRLDGVVLKVLQGGRRKLLDDARKNWRGWKYEGRPVSKRNISINAWAGEVQGTEHPYSLTIRNEARGVYSGKPYVAHVHRAGVTDKAADVLFESWRNGLIPELETLMTRAVLDELGKPGPVKKRRANKVSATTRLTLT